MLVIKVGGGKDLNIDAVVADIVALRAAGQELILVHGGAETTNEVAEALGHPPQFVTSESGYVSRRTDRRTLEIFEMVYCGQLNKMWVEKLQTAGVNAVGLSGLDGGLLRGTRKDVLRIVENGRQKVLRDDLSEYGGGDGNANALLIAAAPELLDVLLRMTEYADDGTPIHPTDNLMQEARAVVARAVGAA